MGVGAVLTVSQGGSPVALQAEVVEHLGQLTATVDLGVAGGEQAAEQRGEGQQHATPAGTAACWEPGSWLPCRWQKHSPRHAGSQLGFERAGSSTALLHHSQKVTLGRQRKKGSEHT